MPYQRLGAPDCAGCNGACTGTCEKAPIGGQIDSTGFLAQEARRVNSIGYTTVELRNLFRLAQISRAAGDDLFAFTSRSGGRSSIRGALDFLVPYALGKKHWAFHTETKAWAIFVELRMAATLFSNASYSGWAAAPALQRTGCLDAGVKNCSESDALLWWPQDSADGAGASKDGND